MEGDTDPHRLFFPDRPVPPEFQVRVIAIAPGHAKRYDEAEWRDALVVVEHGEVELECLGGTRGRFGRGDVLWLVGLPVRALHNRGTRPALMVAVARLS
jgi:hypothetical protein